jgi:hypothetical protein
MPPHQQVAAGPVAESGSGARTDGTDLAAGASEGLAEALRDVARRLDGRALTHGERMRLLQRQAELGDLRDELALRARRRQGARR